MNGQRIGYVRVSFRRFERASECPDRHARFDKACIRHTRLERVLFDISRERDIGLAISLLTVAIGYAPSRAV